MCDQYYDISFGQRRLSEFDAHILTSVSVAPIQPDTEVFVGIGRSTQQVIKNRRSAARQMTIMVDFHGNLSTAIRHESEFEGLFVGADPVLVDIGDGFLYDCVLTNASQAEGVPEVCVSMIYTFSAVRRGEDKTISFTAERKQYHCESTFPITDCSITIHNFRGYDEYVEININNLRFGFPNGISGDLVIDGINKIILDDGENITNSVTWTNFPFLIPGENVFFGFAGSYPTPIDVTLKYHPVYM